MSRLAELRWQCRRGKLELDIVLSGFMAQMGGELSDAELDVLAQLLALPDEELLDLILGKTAVSDAEQARLVALIAINGRP